MKKTLTELIETSCEKYSNLIAFENMGTKMSYAKVERLSRDFASYLLNKTSLKRGDRIALQMPNVLQYPIALIGALRAGLIVVNVNPLYTSEEMTTQLKDAETKAVIILENFAHKLEDTFKSLNHKPEVIITEIGDMLGGFKGFMVNKLVKYYKKLVPKYNLPNAKKFKKVLKIGSSLPFKKLKFQEEEIAFLQYTGGTTGTAKGAILTHKNISSNINQFYRWTKIKLKEANEIQITPLPLYHIAALTNTLCMFNMGAKNVLITNPRDLKSFIKELKKHSFTVLTGVNTLFKALLNKKEFFKVNFSNCKIVMGGAAPIQENVAKKWKAITKTDLVEAYGLTEASPGVIANPVDGNHLINTVGVPLFNTEIKIIDEKGQEVDEGKKGELIVKGPQVMKGYWNNEKETQEVFIDGWLRTGDIATIDDKGYIRIVDRKKETVLISGFNVYPNEIDKIITDHPKVLEAATIGIPDERTGEALKLFIIKKNHSLTKEEIIEYCITKLTRYKIPKYIEFKNELPKSPVGKILKRELKKLEEEKEEVSLI
ncbi:MAG: AMP-binding protein [Bacteroidetes bacterium]|nr:AMP-binding protein [Bacteroidota bacterium]